MKATMPPRVKAHPWISGAVVLVVLAGAAAGTYFGTRTGGASASAATTTVDTVSTGTVKQSVSATGTLAPAEQEELNFAVAGQVTAVAVHQGQAVTKGQALATDRLGRAGGRRGAGPGHGGRRPGQGRSTTPPRGPSDTQLAADNAALTAARNQLASAQAQLAEATLTSPITAWLPRST